jgi:DNA topoisomerase-1
VEPRVRTTLFNSFRPASACRVSAGQSWKEVRHDQTVTWLAYWRDPVNTKEYK